MFYIFFFKLLLPDPTTSTTPHFIYGDLPMNMSKEVIEEMMRKLEDERKSVINAWESDLVRWSSWLHSGGYSWNTTYRGVGNERPIYANMARDVNPLHGYPNVYDARYVFEYHFDLPASGNTCLSANLNDNYWCFGALKNSKGEIADWTYHSNLVKDNQSENSSWYSNTWSQMTQHQNVKGINYAKLTRRIEQLEYIVSKYFTIQ